VSDKEKMSTAIAASGPADKGDKGGPDKGGALPQGGGVQGGYFTPYRPSEGYATRLAIMAIVMAYVLFACHHWFYSWIMIRDLFDGLFRGTFLSFLTNWMYGGQVQQALSWIGVVVLAAGGFAIAYRYIYANPRSSEFLIKTDAEMGKVTWPKISPWFKPETQVWGATYVVLIVVAFLTLYVFGVDMVLQAIANWAFYGS
jgi:preprotein translocase SecE subunit